MQRPEERKEASGAPVVAPPAAPRRDVSGRTTTAPLGSPRLATEPSEPTGPTEPPVAPEPAPKPRPPVVENLPPYAEIRSMQGTEVCGQIATDTTWLAASAPYTVTCDINVTAGVTLTIQPGVAVRFQKASDDLVISGTLRACGPKLRPSSSSPSPVRARAVGGRVAFVAGSSGIWDHTVLEYGGSAHGMLYIASDRAQVLNSIVPVSADTGIIIQGASPLIKRTQDP